MAAPIQPSQASVIQACSLLFDTPPKSFAASSTYICDCHYARPDVFQLRVNEAAQRAVTVESWEPSEK